MAASRNSEAVPANLPEAVAHYHALIKVANTSGLDADHDAATEAWHDICEGEYPIRDEDDAIALLNLMCDEAEDSSGTFIDQITVQVQEFLKKRASPKVVPPAKRTYGIRNWLTLRREIEALANPGGLSAEAMEALLNTVDTLAEDIIAEPAVTEEDVADKLRLALDLASDEAGISTVAFVAANEAMASFEKIIPHSGGVVGTIPELVRCVSFLMNTEEKMINLASREFLKFYVPALEAAE